MSNVDILIVEDEIIVAKDIEQTLASNGFNVVGIARSFEKANEEFLQHLPGLIICDINLRSGLTGIDFIKKVRGDSDIPVIYLTAYSDEETIEKAISTHPGSYITKPFTNEQLLVAVKMILSNESREEESSFADHKPTKRELEIIKCIARGMTSHEIAAELGICFETVQTHRKKILGKNHIHSSSELTALAIKNNWMD